MLTQQVLQPLIAIGQLARGLSSGDRFDEFGCIAGPLGGLRALCSSSKSPEVFAWDSRLDTFRSARFTILPSGETDLSALLVSGGSAIQAATESSNSAGQADLVGS